LIAKTGSGQNATGKDSKQITCGVSFRFVSYYTAIGWVQEGGACGVEGEAILADGLSALRDDEGLPPPAATAATAAQKAQEQDETGKGKEKEKEDGEEKEKGKEKEDGEEDAFAMAFEALASLEDDRRSQQEAVSTAGIGAGAAAAVRDAVGKNGTSFSTLFKLKMFFLPRQALDNHRENSNKDRFFRWSGSWRSSRRSGTENAFESHFYHKTIILPGQARDKTYE